MEDGVEVVEDVFGGYADGETCLRVIAVCTNGAT
jgi:hypothetical protein